MSLIRVFNIDFDTLLSNLSYYLGIQSRGGLFNNCCIEGFIPVEKIEDELLVKDEKKVKSRKTKLGPYRNAALIHRTEAD